MIKKRLSQKAIVEAALKVADRPAGLSGVTVRVVANELGAPPMSLYRHVKSKAHLYDLMAEHIVMQIAEAWLPSTPLSSWKESLMNLARAGRALFKVHPQWVPLLTRIIAPKAAFDVYEQLGAGMRRDRVLPAKQFQALSSLIAYVLGFVLVEHAMTTIPIEQMRLAKVLVLAQEEKYPRLAATLPRFEEWSFDQSFEVGLEALVSSISPRTRSGRAA